MKFALLQLGQMATTALAVLEYGTAESDTVLEALPQCATNADAKWQPAMDFDKDGAYNTAAIYANGQLNTGYDNCRPPQPYRLPSDLDVQNVYARARCNGGWCAHVYGYYFATDVGDTSFLCLWGHRHDWEHVVVWTRDDEPQYVGVSSHGSYQVRPARDVRWDAGTHPKVVYHKDGIGTHAFRFGTETDDDCIENHTGEWFMGPLVSWLGFGDDMLRYTMVDADWGAANVGIGDDNFSNVLDRAKGKEKIPMDTKHDDDDDMSPGEVAC